VWDFVYYGITKEEFMDNACWEAYLHTTEAWDKLADEEVLLYGDRMLARDAGDGCPFALFTYTSEEANETVRVVKGRVGKGCKELKLDAYREPKK
jgi:hypothetical protein